MFVYIRRIYHYKVIGKKSSSDEWEELATREAFKTKRVKVESGVAEGDTWSFAMVCVNKAGNSDNSEVIGPIEMKDDAAPPTAELTTKLEKGCLTIKAGMTVKLTAAISGIPYPEVTIMKDGQDMFKVPKCTINNREGESELLINGCAREHSGKYKIIAKNAAETVKRTALELFQLQADWLLDLHSGEVG